MRVTLRPRQMERPCCKHFPRAGPDSCSVPQPSTGKVPRLWELAHSRTHSPEALLQDLSLQLDTE